MNYSSDGGKATGQAYAPECENCGCDLTNCDVHETSIMWVCTNCNNDEDELETDFRAEERRRMGFTSI